MKKLKFLISFVLVVLILLALPMHSAHAMEELTPIDLIQSNSTKMVMKVYLDQSLSDLRKELVHKGKISPNDIFQKNGSDIFQDDEKDWTIREIIVKNTLTLKPIDSEASNLLKNIIARAIEEKVGQKETQTSKEPDFQEKQRIFAIWGSDIDTSITQYNQLIGRENHAYDSLMNILGEYVNLYNTRKEIASRYMYNSEGVSTYAVKIIEKNGITIQSITRVLEDVIRIKKNWKRNV